MESFLSRYRNLTILLIVIAAQLLLLGYQVKTNTDARLIRLWAVSVVTPVERLLEGIRRNTFGVVEDYFVLLRTRDENRKLKQEMGRVKLENHFLKTELATADRARALAAFQQQTPSKTIPARIIGNGVGAESAMVFVDRGSGSGIESGMAVVTPDGIVGKVIESYPLASSVLLVTDPTFAAGVISQNNHVRGTLKGQGHGNCIVDYVQNEEKVDVGEWFYTSGFDRVFPKGFPVGQAQVVRNGRTLKEIFVSPSGLMGGLEEVLIVLQGVHKPIPATAIPSPKMQLLPLPPDATAESAASGAPSALSTDADRLREQYKAIGDAQHHVFGVGAPGSTPPDFNKKPPGVGTGMTAQAKPAEPPNGITPPAPQPAAGGASTNTAPQQPAAIPGGALPLKPKVTAPATTADRTAPETPAKAKPAPAGPVLVTDPTDADPGSDASAFFSERKPEKQPASDATLNTGKQPAGTTPETKPKSPKPTPAKADQPAKTKPPPKNAQPNPRTP